MAQNLIIRVIYKGKEIGKIGYDQDRSVSSFQYHLDFLNREPVLNLFPYLIRKVKNVQLFPDYSGDTFRGLPPPIADSLPDFFGNIVFQEYLNNQGMEIHQISPLEQLTYVGERGMGALEFRPLKQLSENITIDLSEITQIAQKVLDVKSSVHEKKIDEDALFNIFRLGTSAGGARPKILVSQNRKTGELIPGDINTSSDFQHLIVKLAIGDKDYPQEIIEYIYYKMALEAGIEMMPSRLIAEKHFATERFDRQSGEKQHILTASGLTGWDYKKPNHSSYENLFKLSVDLGVSHKDVLQLFRRMVFNFVYANTDDHLKNFSFIFNDAHNSWSLAPAYDLTFATHPFLKFTRISRACSINGKRTGITVEDILVLAEKFSIRNPKTIIQEVQNCKEKFDYYGNKLNISNRLLNAIRSNFMTGKIQS